MSAVAPSAPNLGHLTPAQLDAIRSTDASILVSAAAGSGKTTVLAERCVALVCDVEPAHRCNIDELLVVTFTDAAAEEMRSRIRATLRRRLDQEPSSAYLQRQIHRLECASISTIHAFCKTLIEQYFPQAEVDPQASVLSAEEAELLREEVLDELFLAHYAGGDAESLAFQGMVDDYGGGNDAMLRQIVLRIHDFISTLPNPEEWLIHSLERVDPQSSQSLLGSLDDYQYQRMAAELLAQVDHCEHLSRLIRNTWPVAGMHADGIDELRGRLEAWLGALSLAKLESWEPVSWDIREFKFERAAARPRNLDDATKSAFDAAKQLRDHAKDLFVSRLQQRLCRFTSAEYREGLGRVAPYVQTLVHLVREFDQRYHHAKTVQAVVDFNDLQRRAYGLLHSPGLEHEQPSDVARRLQQKYRYVLVDEFQDIDPLQEGILRCVSREAADPPVGNLFTVGDIKQSIYRFRLAEPQLFSRRADTFSKGSNLGRVIHLQSNFRSRAPVIDAINLIFEPLMSRHFGGSDYDQHARLCAGAAYPENEDGLDFDRPAVEMHLLEPITEQTRAAVNSAGQPTSTDDEPDAESDPTGPSTPEEDLAGIEREAYLIGRLIRAWMGQEEALPRRRVAGKPAVPGGPPVMRPVEYRDMVILLRSLPYKAEPIADVLRRMGMPVRIERQAGGFHTTEFRDCLSILQLMDNLQQDIPLAAVLRSPLLGDAFDETDLLKIRLLNREVPFHAAVRQYLAEGTDAKLRERLTRMVDIIERYRTRVQRTPVADVLWEIYEEYNYLGYVTGLPDGTRRREHLLRLHELARQFGHFARQGLRRFLHFIDELAARQRDPRQAGIGGDEDCIRIMTVHASKGLEFPVVILADLQKRFNLEDLHGTALVDREYGIALRASDPERRVFYPTLVHQLAAEAALRENLSEELRVLYVALTRAREHLVLLGRISPERVALYRSMQESRASTPQATALPRLQLECATHPLEWLLTAISAAPADNVYWRNPKDPRRRCLFQVTAYPRQITDTWCIPKAIEPERAAELANLANFESLPEEEPVAGLEEARQLVAALSQPYPGHRLTSIPSRLPVGELKRRWQSEDGRMQEERLPASAESFRIVEPPRPAFLLEAAPDDPTARGTATHRFLQLVDLARPCTLADLQLQRSELCEQCRLTTAETAAILLDGAAWFFSTELGGRVRAAAGTVRREVAFDARIAPEFYDARTVAMDNRDVILIRGVIDLILSTPQGIEIIDYKTDQLAHASREARINAYRPQLDIYARAMEGIYRAQVTHRWLVFLDARMIALVGDK